jgi:hypothetical protein
MPRSAASRYPKIALTSPLIGNAADVKATCNRKALSAERAALLSVDLDNNQKCYA